ncbi:MAG TPA: carbon monoxide dehydrogenase subunit G [Blastocatellia bacterium]|nr:carbon monoxide dehydrogenase subunit G [Blastocatellia bacterium]
MKIEGTHELRASPQRVYETLTDPAVLQRCIPGCERLEKSDENAYSITLKAGVGAIKGVFNGNVRLEDLKAPDHFRMIVEGRGQPGFLKGTGDIDLTEPEGATLVSYSGEVQVGGTIAGVGQRMLQGAAKMMATQFFTAIEAEARSKVDEPPRKHGFFRTALRWLSGFFRRVV